MIKKRLQKLIRILLNQEDYTTIQLLAEQLEVSYRTVANDLKTIEKCLSPYPLTLSKKTGSGIRLVGSDEAKLQVSELTEQASTRNPSLSPQARVIYIGIKLLLSKNCRVYLLAKELFVSRSTVHKDLLEISQLFSDYKITLNRDNQLGIIAEGSEKNFRNCLVELLKRDSGYPIFCQLVQGNDLSSKETLLFSAFPLTGEEISVFLQVIKQTRSKYLQTCTFESLVQVLLYCLVSFVRINRGDSVHLSREFVTELESQPYHSEVKAICQAVEQAYLITYSETEMRYLQVFFLSLQSTDTVTTADREDAELLAHQLIAKWEELLPYPFSKDLELRDALFQHFCSAVTRYKHQIPSENVLTEEIRLKLPHTLDVIHKSKSVIEERYHCRLDEEELGLLTLHLAAALEKMKQPLQTLLVCHKGIGAATLLVRKLESHFPNILSVRKTILLPDVSKKELEEMDLILTTVQLSSGLPIPILKIEPILSRQELFLLRKSLLPYYEEKNDHLKKQEKRISS